MIKPVMIRAIVQEATPERQEYKPYRTTLHFDDKLIIEIPVSSEYVRKEGDKTIISLEGYTSLLNTYTTAIEKMHQTYLHKFQ